MNDKLVQAKFRYFYLKLQLLQMIFAGLEDKWNRILDTVRTPGVQFNHKLEKFCLFSIVR